MKDRKNNQGFAYLKPQASALPMIGISVLVHVLAIGVLVGGGMWRDAANAKPTRARITALLKKGVEKPENWLPRKQAAVAPPPQNTRPPAQTEKAPETQPAPAPAKKTQSPDYSQQMQAALASLQGDASAKPDDSQAGSPDGVDEGDSLVAELGNQYQTLIYKAVKAQYGVPSMIPERERMFLTATVAIFLGSQGQLLRMEFEKRSDNPLFDEAVQAAIHRAAPFPVPPKELHGKYRDEGIGLIFAARKM